MALTVLDGAAESSASSLFSWRTRLVGRGTLPTEIAATMDNADQVVLGCLLVAWSKMKKNNAHQLGKEIWHKRLQVGLWNSTGARPVSSPSQIDLLPEDQRVEPGVIWVRVVREEAG
ncbi:hypothetical protein RRG08_065235 [Elysia crispata]|uniref:Uncharacterized protein n=1 Tax=Elysia crispata TaxID=231223 RepID=A0AAE1CYT4_9GAST|nr:hypothetical protein RRG08_065235 [Elysia crispata]